jgi:hypothetical protein
MFFHQQASRRRMQNIITKLIRLVVFECTNINELHGMATDFYRKLFELEGTSNLY